MGDPNLSFIIGGMVQGDKIMCDKCHKPYSFSYFIQKHRKECLKSRPLESMEREFQCNLCPKTFALKSSLHNHRRTHRKQIGTPNPKKDLRESFPRRKLPKSNKEANLCKVAEKGAPIADMDMMYDRRASTPSPSFGGKLPVPYPKNPNWTGYAQSKEIKSQYSQTVIDLTGTTNSRTNNSTGPGPQIPVAECKAPSRLANYQIPKIKRPEEIHVPLPAPLKEDLRGIELAPKFPTSQAFDATARPALMDLDELELMQGNGNRIQNIAQPQPMHPANRNFSFDQRYDCLRRPATNSEITSRWGSGSSSQVSQGLHFKSAGPGRSASGEALAVPMVAPTRTAKTDLDYDRQILECQKIAGTGNLTKAIEDLTALEKETRTGSHIDMVSTGRVHVAIVQLCFQAKKWDLLNENINILAKRRGQLKGAVVKMVQEAQTYIDQMPTRDLEYKLINTLRSVTEGKAYVEVERARLTYKLAKMREEEGNIALAGSIMQELQMESYSMMERREKVELMLEQMRYCIAKNDYIRTKIISKKINVKFFDEESPHDLKLKYYKLMVACVEQEGISSQNKIPASR